MSRYRRRSKPHWFTFPFWAVVALAVGWGLWQFAQFRHTLIAQGEQAPLAADPVSASPVAPTPAMPASRIVPTADAALLQDAMPPADSPHAAPGPPQNPAALTATAIVNLDAGRILQGRSDLNAALAVLQDDPRAAPIRRQLAALNTGVFLGSAILPEDPLAHYVDIQPGDSFLKLGRLYKVPAAFLESINPNLNPRNLKPTTGVKIVRGPFNLRLIKHRGRLDLYIRELYVRSFAAELEEGNYLPRGDYRVKAGAKIQVGSSPSREWIGFEGVDPATRDIASGWIYGSAGMRRGGQNDDTGIKVDDATLQQLYQVLMETHSTIRVLP